MGVILPLDEIIWILCQEHNLDSEDSFWEWRIGEPEERAREVS